MGIGKKRGRLWFGFRGHFLYQIRDFIKQVWQGYRRWRMLTKHCRQLLEMTDHNLKDIGISRADAVRYARQRDSLWQCMFKNTNALNSGNN